MSDELVQKIHTFFQAVADHDFSVIKYPRGGMCGNLNRYLPDKRLTCHKNFVLQGFQEWEHYSGEIKYPVPHPKITAKDAYHTCDGLYDPKTNYGQKRISLAAHMAEWVLENKEKLNSGLINRVHNFFQAFADHDFSVISNQEDCLFDNLIDYLNNYDCKHEYHKVDAFVCLGFEDWEQFSGCNIHPVPHLYLDDEEAYVDDETTFKYDLDTDYGKKIIALSAHMAEWVLDNKEKFNGS